jgi:hypothetical protein
MEVVISCIVMFVGVVYDYYTVDGSGIAGRDELVSMAIWSRGTH